MRAEYSERTVEEMIELRERGFSLRKARMIRSGDLLSYHAYGEWDLVLDVENYVDEHRCRDDSRCVRLIVMRTKHEGTKHLELGFHWDVEMLFVQSSSDV